jgi:peptide/nickel transport system permease protein
MPAAAPGASDHAHFAARRIIQAIPILLGVSLVVFGLVHIVPGNPIDMLMPPEASPGRDRADEGRVRLRPAAHVQHCSGSAGLRGDFGLSVSMQRRCGASLWPHSAIPSFAILAAMLGFSLGIGCGLLAATFHGRWPDKLFSAIATTGVSLPHYWCAIVLVLACAVLHDWLPAQGMGDDSLPLYDRLEYLVLPVVTLSLIPMGVIARLVRATVLEILGQEFVGALTANGLPRWPVIRHVCKNAAPPVLARWGCSSAICSGARSWWRPCSIGRAPAIC